MLSSVSNSGLKFKILTTPRSLNIFFSDYMDRIFKWLTSPIAEEGSGCDPTITHLSL